MRGEGFANPMKDPENWLKPELVAILFSKAKQHSYRNWLILTLLLRTGRRIGELLQLKPKDVNVEQEMILWNIEKKKNVTKKWKAIDGESLDLLIDYVSDNQIQLDEYVFFSPIKGREFHISRQAVFIFLQKYAKAMGVHIHPHTFRHTFSVWVAQHMKNPSDLKKLKDLLEHSNISMTEHYLQFAPGETKNLLEETFTSPGDEK